MGRKSIVAVVGIVAMVVAAASAQGGPRPRRHARHEAKQEKLSDANILEEMKQGDSVEVVLSKWVRAHTENRALTAYTETLTRDHTKGVRDAERLAERVKIRPEAPADDTTGQHNQHVEERLEHTEKGFAFDTAAAEHWVRDHKNDIADTEKMIREAKDPKVRAGARQEMPTLRRHLSEAERLVATLEREHGRAAQR